jgi:transposase
VKLDREREGEAGALGESERRELARLRALKAAWEKERAELEMERGDAPMFVKLSSWLFFLVRVLPG